VALIANQAVAWGDLIIGDAEQQFNDAFVAARQRAEENIMRGRARAVADPQQMGRVSYQSPVVESTRVIASS